jgi:Lar family restriction alleviation protein
VTDQPLKPCPFCGSATAPTLIMRSVSNHVECARPYAGGCGTRGPYKSDPQEAIAAWNKRA